VPSRETDADPRFERPIPVPCIICSTLTRSGSRCERHRVSGWSTTTSRAERGYGAEWAKIRRVVLEEEPTCRLCGQQATDVDHVIPKARGGTDRRSNLRALCRRCHKRKSSSEGGQARNARWLTKQGTPDDQAGEHLTRTPAAQRLAVRSSTEAPSAQRMAHLEAVVTRQDCQGGGEGLGRPAARHSGPALSSLRDPRGSGIRGNGA
jgi:5-methylcytosine-specific restriction enzyme A